MLVNTYRAGTSIRASIKLWDSTNSDTGIGDWVLRECAYLLQHSFWSTNPFTNKDVIRAFFPAPAALNPLLLIPPSLDPPGLPCNQSWNSSPQKGPPYLHHKYWSVEAFPCAWVPFLGPWVLTYKTVINLAHTNSTSLCLPKNIPLPLSEYSPDIFNHCFQEYWPI